MRIYRNVSLPIAGFTGDPTMREQLAEVTHP